MIYYLKIFIHVRQTWRYSFSDPGVLELHLLHLFIWAKQQAISFLTEVVRALQVPDDSQLLFQSLYLRYRCRHNILVMHWDGGMVEPNHLAHLSGPET